MKDRYVVRSDTPSAPAVSGESVTTSDSDDLSELTRSLWVGVGGDVAVEFLHGQQVTLTAVPGGTLLPIRVRKVLSTGTTADSIVALY